MTSQNMGAINKRLIETNIKPVMWVGALLPALLMIVVASVALVQFSSLKEDNDWVDHTYEVIIKAHQIEKLMVDLETGQRGFIITGKNNFLEPYEQSKHIIISNIGKLKEKVSDNIPQVARLSQLEREINKWLDTAGQPEIDARNQYSRGEVSFEFLAQMLIDETGKDLVDNSRNLLKDFILVEEKLIENRKEQTHLATLKAENILILGMIMIVLSSLFLGWYSSRQILISDWIKSKQAMILSSLQGSVTITEFSHSLLTHLVPTVSAQTATMYGIDSKMADNDKIGRMGAYGISSTGAPETIRKGDGLVSQCFTTGEEVHINNVPDDYYDIVSSLGKAKPKEIILLPIKYENIVIAVIELASFTAHSKKELTLLHEITNSIGVMINNIRTGVKTKHLLEDIRISEERSSSIINGSVDTMITIDKHGIVQSFNLAGELLFGYREEELVGKNVKMLMPNPFRQEHDSYLDNYHNTGVKKIINIGREVKAKKKDGTVFPISLSVTEINLTHGTIYSGTIRDITDTKAAEANLQQANAELEEFAYRTSHDLRSPIISSTRLLEMAKNFIADKDYDMTLQSLSHAQSSLAKLDTLIGDILVLSEAKNRQEDDTAVDISTLVEEALKKLEHMEHFDRLDIQKSFRFEGVLCTKEIRINMILENLISNAIKYQDTKRQTSYIKISTYNDGNSFVLEVEDNGLGIPEEQQDSLFTMFKRFHPRTAFGSGLGLYLMKKSADVLGGKVTFQSLEEGSIFRLNIPV